MSKLFKIALVKMVDFDGKVKFASCLFNVKLDKLTKSFPHRVVDVMFLEYDYWVFNEALDKQQAEIYVRDYRAYNDSFINVAERDFYFE